MCDSNTGISLLYSAFKNGDSLDDSEVLALYKHLKATQEKLFPLGCEFALAWRQLGVDKRTLEGFINARNERGAGIEI